MVRTNDVVELEAQQKSLTVIIVLLGGRLERQKEIVDRFDLCYVDVIALNDDEKGLSIDCFSFFIFLTIYLESGNAELSVPKKLFVNPKTVLTTLYLFFRS
jgi:hypothetical protein